MTADTTGAAAEEAAAAKSSLKNAARSALESGRAGLGDAFETAERSLHDASKRVEKVLREGVEALKAQTERLHASEQFEDVQKYVVERVKERPVTATLAGIGVGVLIGLLLAGGRNSR